MALSWNLVVLWTGGGGSKISSPPVPPQLNFLFLSSPPPPPAGWGSPSWIGAKPHVEPGQKTTTTKAVKKCLGPYSKHPPPPFLASKSQKKSFLSAAPRSSPLSTTEFDPRGGGGGAMPWLATEIKEYEFWLLKTELCLST